MTERKLVVDFTEYPELYDELREAALREMRPPEMQVLFYLQGVLEK